MFPLRETIEQEFTQGNKIIYSPVFHQFYQLGAGAQSINRSKEGTRFYFIHSISVFTDTKLTVGPFFLTMNGELILQYTGPLASNHFIIYQLCKAPQVKLLTNDANGRFTIHYQYFKHG